MKPPAKPARPLLRLTLILGTLNALGAFSIDMYLSAFPSLAADLRTTAAPVQLTLSIFVLGLALGQLVYGPLVDRFGRRPLLLGGIALYGLASLALVFAPTIESFIALRFVQALGGCAGMIIGRAIVHDLFRDETEAARAFSLILMVQICGPVIAPVLGGIIVATAGWRAVFLFLAALGAAGFCAVLAGIPESLPPAARRHETPRAVALSYLRLFASAPFIVPALAGAVTLSSLFAYLSSSPFIFMELFGLTPVQYGWLFAFNACALLAAGQVNRLLLKRLAPRRLLTGGLVACVASNLALILVADTRHLALFLVPLCLSIATRPVIVANATAMAMTATGTHAGGGSAIIGALQFGLGAALAALSGLLHNGTAYPMAAIMLAASVLGLAIYKLAPSGAVR